MIKTIIFIVVNILSSSSYHNHYYCYFRLKIWMNAAETATIVMQTLFAPTSSDPTGANALLDILVMAETAQVSREF